MCHWHRLITQVQKMGSDRVEHGLTRQPDDLEPISRFRPPQVDRAFSLFLLAWSFLCDLFASNR